MNLDLTYLLWTTIVTLVVSHLSASYLTGVTPRGYWFWFTILSIIISLIFM